MIVTQIAKIIADFLLFLDLTDDETLDPDAAVEMMEYIGKELKDLDKSFLRELVDAFPVIAVEYKGEARQLVLDIASDFFLE